ncbi:MAG: O-antigen ligase family protein [Sarcina sp.]
MKNFVMGKSNRNNGLLNLTLVDKIILLMAILNPILYYISPILLIISIVIELVLVFSEKDYFYKKFWKGLLLAVTFYGVSIFHVKVYYWVFILSLPYIIFFVRNKLSRRKIIFLAATGIFAIYLTVLLFLHGIKGYTVSEYIRYIMCFIILYITVKTFKNRDEIKEIFHSIKVVALVNVISGIIVAIFTLSKHLGFSCSAHGKLYSIDIFNAVAHFRATGFFSDPNLYCSFFMFLLAIYEFIKFYSDRERTKFLDVTNIILIVGVLISFSRTGMMTVAAYLIAKFIAIKVLKASKRANNTLWATIIIVFIILAGLFSQEILAMMNWLLYHITILIGRKSALVYSSNFTDSSRVKSWEVALNSLRGHWILGRGYNYWQTIYYMPPHNSFIMTLQETGIIGLVAFLGLVGYSIRKIPIYIILFLIFIPMSTLDLQNFLMLFMLMGIALTFLDEKKAYN